MKKTLALVLCLLFCLTSVPLMGSADEMYLLPHSSTKKLTEEELRLWDRESLTYMFNEILARHGYVFQSGGRYEAWFSAMPWYKPNKNPDNEKACYPYVTSLEWENIRLIKKVAAEMDAQKTPSHNSKLKCYTQLTPPSGDWKLTGFSYLQLQTGQNLPVYSAPSTKGWRGANGKAMVSTSGAVWAAGWVNSSWLLVFYETNHGAIRVGYVQKSKIEGKISLKTQLQFDQIASTVVSKCNMTDDPLKANTTMATLKKGDQVTYLSTMINQNGESWDYIETTVDAKKARGFVPHGALNIPEADTEDWESYSK